MKRLLILLLTLSIAACGANAEREDRTDAQPDESFQSLLGPGANLTAPQFQAIRAKAALHDAPAPDSYTLAYTSGEDWQQVLFPASTGAQRLCTITSYLGSGANSTATWGNGAPKHGPLATLDWLGNTSAPEPMFTAVAGKDPGTVWTTAKCYHFPYFENIMQWPWQWSQTFAKWDSDGQGPHTGDLPLWQGDAFCYLKGFGGLAHSSEDAYVYKQNGGYAGGFLWRLRAHTSGEGRGGANCAYLGRSYYTLGTQNAYTNQPANLGFNANEAVCLLSGVWGDTGNGIVTIAPGSDGVYRLTVTGGIWRAQAYCVSYYDPNG